MKPFDMTECRQFCDRRNRARQFANVGDPIDLDRPMPVLRHEPSDDDIRPPALSRGPCPRCETRGDIGCAHQRPYEAPIVPHAGRSVTRWDFRRSPRGDEL